MNNPLEVKRTSPLKMLAPLIVFLVIAMAWSIYWYLALGKAQERLAAFEASYANMTCRDRGWGGYPFRVHFDCTGFQTTFEGADISADKLRLIGQAWNPNHIIGGLFGPVRINSLEVSGEPIRFSYRTSNGTLALASLLAEKQSVQFSTDRQLTIARTEIHLKPSSNPKRLDLAATLSGLSTGSAQLDSFKVTGTMDQAIPREGTFEFLSEPSEYLDAIWVVQHLANLGDAEMTAAQAVITPLLKANNNKLPIQLKDKTWYWGPFAVAKSE